MTWTSNIHSKSKKFKSLSTENYVIYCLSLFSIWFFASIFTFIHQLLLLLQKKCYWSFTAACTIVANSFSPSNQYELNAVIWLAWRMKCFLHITSVWSLLVFFIVIVQRTWSNFSWALSKLTFFTMLIYLRYCSIFCLSFMKLRNSESIKFYANENFNDGQNPFHLL